MIKVVTLQILIAQVLAAFAGKRTRQLLQAASATARRQRRFSGLLATTLTRHRKSFVLLRVQKLLERGRTACRRSKTLPQSRTHGRLC